jgi:hypothetical protein
MKRRRTGYRVWTSLPRCLSQCVAGSAYRSLRPTRARPIAAPPPPRRMAWRRTAASPAAEARSGSSLRIARANGSQRRRRAAGGCFSESSQAATVIDSSRPPPLDAARATGTRRRFRRSRVPRPGNRSRPPIAASVPVERVSLRISTCPPGSARGISGRSWRPSRSRVPMRSRKRSASAQHPSRMCWPLSTIDPVTGSLQERARPPSWGRPSSTVTLAPASARAVAAASPANPPPTTTASGAPDGRPFIVRPRRDRSPRRGRRGSAG